MQSKIRIPKNRTTAPRAPQCKTNPKGGAALIHVRMPQALFVRVERIAKQLGTDVPAVIKLAVHRHFERAMRATSK
jgi:hypothetical protein